MKRGDKFPVSVRGVDVGYAEVIAVGDGTVTLLIPAQQAVVAFRMELEQPKAAEPATETIITGVDRVSESTAAPAQPAPTQPIVQSGGDVAPSDNPPATVVPPAAGEAVVATEPVVEATPDSGVESDSGLNTNE